MAAPKNVIKEEIKMTKTFTGFKNLIPALKKQRYFKEDSAVKDQGVVSYTSTALGNHATVTLNHDTGDVVFTYTSKGVLPVKLERFAISDADQQADAVMIELDEFNQLARAVSGSLSNINVRRSDHRKPYPTYKE